MKQRYSKKRERILEVLQSAREPLSAAQIHVRIPDIDLTTIYRNLETFTESGQIKNLHIRGRETVYEFQEKPHHHALCTECGEVVHFTAPDAPIRALLGLRDFNVQEVEVTVRGTCRKKHKK